MSNPKTRRKGVPDYAIGKRLRARSITLDNNRGRGVQLRFGPFLATVLEGHAIRFANRIIDAIETGPDTEPAPQPAKAPTEPQPCYSTRTDNLTAADGAPEPDLPAAPAENE